MKASSPLLVLFVAFVLAVVFDAPGSEGLGLHGNGSAAADGGSSGALAHARRAGVHPPAREITLHGRLIDLTGRAVADAEILDRLSGGRTLSRQDGSFELAVAGANGLHLDVDAETARDLFRVLPQQSPVTLLVRPSRPWLSAATSAALPLESRGRGLISGGDGPVRITVCETGQSVYANGDGEFEIPIPRTPFHLIAHDESSHAVLSDELPAPARGQQWLDLPALVLTAGLRAGGSVSDHEGNPIAGAALEVCGHGVRRRVTADAGGDFEIGGLVEGRYTITALPYGGLVGCTEEAEVLADQPVDLDLALDKEQPLDIRVVDEAGASLSGVYVQATEAGNTWSAGLTDASGKVLLRGLGDGERQFEVFVKTGESYASIEVVRFSESDARLVVRR